MFCSLKDIQGRESAFAKSFGVATEVYQKTKKLARNILTSQYLARNYGNRAGIY
jgi:hypothetical protein